jgi:hypothetical protein
MQKRHPRKYWWNNALYLIRDQYNGSKFAGMCEYAVRNPSGSKKWLLCVEGVMFTDIAPLRVRRG